MSFAIWRSTMGEMSLPGCTGTVVNLPSRRRNCLCEPRWRTSAKPNVSTIDITYRGSRTRGNRAGARFDRRSPGPGVNRADHATRKLGGPILCRLRGTHPVQRGQCPVCRRSCATSAKGRGGPNVCNGWIDEGRPLGTGLQEQVPNHLRRLWSKAMVVSTEGKGLGRTRSGDWQEEDREGTTDHVSKA